MIAAARLDLRPAVADDLAWTLEHINTPAVMRHLGGVRDPAVVAAGFARGLEAIARDGYGYWTIWLRASGQRIGKCGFSVIDGDAAPAGLRGEHEIGWSVAEPFWGQGLATEAACAALDHGFTTLGLATTFSQTSASNGPSTRLMERLGFARRAALDYADPAYPPADNPTTVYRMTAEMWAARCAARAEGRERAHG